MCLANNIQESKNPHTEPYVTCLPFLYLQELLSDFINTSEWADIIAECDPDYSPCDNEMLGLRNVHVFGLANVLRRPILLIDSVAGMQSSGDYSGKLMMT